MRRFLLSSLVLLGALACAAPSSDHVGAAIEPVYNGRTTTAFPEVVAVVRLGRTGDGGLCTGTVIGPYAVMTAKHCVFEETASGWSPVPRSEFIVIVGSNINEASGIERMSAVYDILTTPGSNVDADISNGNDIAILTLPATLGTISRGIASPTRGGAVTMVGFGRNNRALPETGVKYTGTGFVRGFDADLVQSDGTAGTCQGDSGGPLFDSGGDVIGITSFGPGDCRITVSVYTRASKHRALIDSALAFVPPCDPGPEACDGVDNDCDDLVDEGCIGLGDACSTDVECSNGSCVDTGGGRVCTRDCDPRDAIPRCPVGFFCDALGCGAGQCIEGGPGPKPDGEECAGPLECASNSCADVAGTMRCGRQCTVGMDACPAGDLCDVVAGECGSCIPVELSTGPRPYGSPCDADGDCAEAMCLEGFCTRACAAHLDCGGGFHCREGLCVRGDPGVLGDACGVTDDCGSMAPDCVDIELDRVCASECGDTCPLGFECATTSGGERCVAEGVGLGGECADHPECRSGICAGVCTQLCEDTPCPEGFACLEAGDHFGCFVEADPPPPPTPTPTSSGGCATARGSQSAASAGFVLLVGGLAFARRRRG